MVISCGEEEGWKALHAKLLFSVFFFNDTATTEIYTLSLHDALPIYFVVRIVSFGLSAPELSNHFDLKLEIPHAVGRTTRPFGQPGV